MILTESAGPLSVELVPLRPVREWIEAHDRFATRPLRPPSARRDIWWVAALARLRPGETSGVFEREERFATADWLAFADGLIGGADRPVGLSAESGQFGIRACAADGEAIEIVVTFEELQTAFRVPAGVAAEAGRSMKSAWAGMPRVW